MYELYESTIARRGIKKLPNDILKRYEKWKDIARLTGVTGLREIKGFHDEALKGKWAGCRSSRLGLKFRVIYLIEKDEVYIEVIDITAHDYKRK